MKIKSSTRYKQQKAASEARRTQRALDRKEKLATCPAPRPENIELAARDENGKLIRKRNT